MNALDRVIALVLVRRLVTSGTAKEIRLGAGLSLADIATACGIDQSTVSRWERGERTPTGEGARRYGELLAALSSAADL